MEMQTYITLKTSYQERMLEILDDTDIPLYLREHYSESPSYYGNEDPDTMIDTLIWLSKSDAHKKQELDKELSEYISNV